MYLTLWLRLCQVAAQPWRIFWVYLKPPLEIGVCVVLCLLSIALSLKLLRVAV